VDISQARDFFRHHHRAVLITHRRDGSLQTSPLMAVTDDDGRLMISTRETAMKTKNLARDPRITLCGLSDEFFGEWVQVDGTAEIVHLPEAMDLLVDYYRRISGEHPDWDDYRRAMEEEQRVMVLVTIERAGPNVSG